MLFDLSPKTSRRDFYNFDEELEKLHKLFWNSRIVAVIGPRRAGKTSLILTFLNEYRVPFVFVDCRRISLSRYGSSFRGFAEEFTRALNDFVSRFGDRGRSLLEFLKGVRGVEVDVFMARVALRWGRRDRVDIFELLNRINRFGSDKNTKVALVFDELQELQQLNIDFAKLLAYVYDHLESITVIVSGSQVGLLYDMLRVEDPLSPLYGRAIAEVSMGRLSRDKAVDFLTKGFRELGIDVDRNIIERAVDILDGIVGWLTFFGWSYANGVHSIDEVVDIAARQEAEEIERFLSRARSGRRYRGILRAVAEGRSRWGDIKRALEVFEGVEIDDKNFSDLLKKLVKAGFLEKRGEEYAIADPITLRAVQKYLQ